MEYVEYTDETELCLCSEEECSEHEYRTHGGDNTDSTSRIAPGHQRSGYGKNRNLLDAVENCDLERISRLLKLDASPNATCRRNYISACHIAALNNSASLSLLIKSGAKSFKPDKLGRTPLYFAAWMGHAKQIAVLLGLPEHLQNKITDTLSEKTMDEIKKAFEKGQLANILATIRGLSAPSENSLRLWKDTMDHNCCQKITQLPPIEPGSTALHAASARAHVSCVQLLVAAGASQCACDDAGRTPLDVVGSAFYLGFNVDAMRFSDTIKVLLSSGATFKKNIEEIENIERNTPLHTAVELESLEAIKLLLDAGASVTCLNKDGLTAMHICVQKRLRDHLQLLLNYHNPNDYEVPIVDTKNKHGMTILHSAVIEKWTSGVHIALKAGANLSILSNEGKSPVHAAVATDNVEILQEMTKYFTGELNIVGWSPLFIAVANNNLELVKILVSNGASFAITEPLYFNVLHIAAIYGYTEILAYLIDNCTESSLINEIASYDSSTPLFHVVVNNQEECVKLLLSKGAFADCLFPFQDNTYGEILTTVLHIAAAKNYKKIVEILLHFDHRLINQRNSVGLQPLHEACLHANRDIISLLIHKGADLSAEYTKSKSPLDILMINLPKPTAFMEDIFDSYISSQGMNIQHRECKVTVDYKVLLPNDTDGEIKVIKALIMTGNRHNQKRLLQHPLIESFLYLKWEALLPFFYAIMMLYFSFVLSLNLYVMSVFFYSNVTDADNETGTFVRNYSDTWKYMTYVTCCLIAVQIVFMKIKTEKSYFLFLETWMNVLTTAVAVLLPSIVLYFGPEIEWVRLLATIVVLLSWLEIMFLLSRFPNWGFYVLMFGKVTKKVIKVLMTFGFVIIGFSICFMIQFRGNPPFETLWAAVTKTFVMMTSEYDYTSTISHNNANEIKAHLSILRLVFLTFVILASVVLMNLLIGVAVNDVNNLEEKGNQKRLEKQVDFLMSMEYLPEFICEKFPKIFNQSFLTDEKYIVLSPRLSTCKYYNVLPTHIREAIFEKAQKQKKKIDDELGLDDLKLKLNEILKAIAKHDYKLDKISEYLQIKH